MQILINYRFIVCLCFSVSANFIFWPSNKSNILKPQMFFFFYKNSITVWTLFKTNRLNDEFSKSSKLFGYGYFTFFCYYYYFVSTYVNRQFRQWQVTNTINEHKNNQAQNIDCGSNKYWSYAGLESTTLLSYNSYLLSI